MSPYRSFTNLRHWTLTNLRHWTLKCRPYSHLLPPHPIRIKEGRARLGRHHAKHRSTTATYIIDWVISLGDWTKRRDQYPGIKAKPIWVAPLSSLRVTKPNRAAQPSPAMTGIDCSINYQHRLLRSTKNPGIERRLSAMSTAYDWQWVAIGGNDLMAIPLGTYLKNLWLVLYGWRNLTYLLASTLWNLLTLRLVLWKRKRSSSNISL